MALKKKGNGSGESGEARLRRELADSRARETATAAILKVIRRSPGDAQPVFAAILQSCEKLFRGFNIGISVVGDDGQLHLGAYRGPGEKKFASYFPMPLSMKTGAGSAILTRRVLQYADLADHRVPAYVRRSAKATDSKSGIFAPMLLKGKGIGAIYVTRDFVGAFSEKECALLQTFADQAVIAIENARAFNETTEALERQTATAEILKVISSSPTDTQPVFDAIVANSRRLFPGGNAVLLLRQESKFVMAGYSGLPLKDLPDQVTSVPLDRGKNFPSRAILDGEGVHVPDWEADDVPEF